MFNVYIIHAGIERIFFLELYFFFEYNRTIVLVQFSKSLASFLVYMVYIHYSLLSRRCTRPFRVS